MILLTDEEKQAAVDNYEYRHLSSLDAQLTAQLKKVYNWGNELCNIHQEDKFRRQCGYCWQALLEEVKE